MPSICPATAARPRTLPQPTLVRLPARRAGLHADAKAIRKAHLVGHSLGGAIALARADHPDRIASVTVICSAGLGPEIDMVYIDGFMAAKRRQLQPVLEMLVADPEMVSHEMIEDVLKFKRLDGVETALNQVIEGTFAGRQALQLSRPPGGARRAGPGDLGPAGPDHPGAPQRRPVVARPGARVR